MSVSATYVDASAKVTVAVTSAPSNAQTVLIERSPDGVTWTTVRGASKLTLVSSAVSIDDYEFTDGVVNNYRATYFDSTSPVAVGSPAAATVTTSAGSSASATPVMPTGLTTGDVVFIILASTKSTAVVPTAPTGWTALAADPPDSMAVYVTTWTASLSIPAFTMTGLASGDKVIGKAIGMRNVSASLGNAQVQINTAATNTIAFPAFTSLANTAAAGPLVLFSRSINTGATPAALTNDTATGYSLLTYVINPANYSASSVTLTGGVSATSGVIQVNMAKLAFVSQETGTVTPALSTVWLKNPLQPYLNRKLTVIGIDTITNPSRTATFAVINRNLVVAVSDVFGGRQTSLTVRTVDETTLSDLRNCLMTGQIQFVHAPKGARTPTGYFVLGDLAESFVASTSTARYLVFGIIEVATPSPTLAAVLSTYQTVLSTYATYQALATAKASYAAVLQLVGSPTDVITS